MSDVKVIKVSAPGRICLFGEHQDYLGLCVISAAIDRRISVSGVRIDEKILEIELPDIGGKEIIHLGKENSPKNKRDYLRSSFNVLHRSGIEISSGYRCRIESTIPIGKGVSSSSALTVAWIKFLHIISGIEKPLLGFELAEYAFKAEVQEFNEPGGMQDHLCAAMGGMLFMDFSEEVKVSKMSHLLSGFVLCDSGITKDTIGVLARIKSEVADGVKIIKKHIDDFSLIFAPLENIRSLKIYMPDNIYRTICAVINIRDLTIEARSEIEKDIHDSKIIGELFTRHHALLRDGLLISTPQIERLIDAAMNGGALGCKINGSGGGGCFIAYCPGHEEDVIEQIKKAGGDAHKVTIDEGVKADVSSCH